MIRRDARDVVLKESKVEADDGGDFYGAFWSDAKKFVLKGLSLKQQVKARIAASKAKRKLYPVLLEGFSRWYGAYHGAGDPARRLELSGAFGRCSSLAEAGAVRVHNLLAWKEDDCRHLVYGYFDKEYALTPRAARLGLWAMASALSDHRLSDMAILDVMRGQVYDNDNCPLAGNEEEILSERYQRILSEWETQKRLLRAR